MAENQLSCHLGHKKKKHSRNGSKELRQQAHFQTHRVSGGRWMASEFHCYKARLAERPDSAFHPPKASQTGCDHNFGKAVKVKVYHRFTTWPKICFLVASATRKKHSRNGSKELRQQAHFQTHRVSGGRWMASEFHCYKARLA